MAPQDIPCKVCQTPARLVGGIDFNRNCLEQKGIKLPIYGFSIYYRQCPSCGFLFTVDFDDWGNDDFANNIYNSDYAAIDPGYDDSRPAGFANYVADILKNKQGRISILDFGGGNGRFAELMRGAGFTCDTYDPFNPVFATPPEQKYDVVTCFETIEHTPDPRGTTASICSFIKDGGVSIFSTLVQPEHFDKIGLSWWYVGPRNGHISIHSATSLALMWRNAGYAISQLTGHVYLAQQVERPGR
jgi:2-polyprenyl-6-hydroxyphenyl methylase/3-demethylubiquinone-9 3-methyltransferase